MTMHRIGTRAALLACCLVLCLPALAQPQARSETDPIRVLVKRLELARYKATIKGLTRFGDRRQGTARNRAAIDWIEAQLKSYGCANIERLTYQFGEEPPHRVAAPPPSAQTDEPQFNVGGARARGVRGRTGVNDNPNAQPDMRLRALDLPLAMPGDRQEVWCTKIGATHPDEMYIVSAHMDGIGFGEAAN